MTARPVHEVSHTCPHCGVLHASAGNIRGSRAPAPGDATLCTVCGGWSVVDDAGKLRVPTAAVVKTLATDRHAVTARMTWEVAKTIEFARMPTRGRA